MVAFILEHVTIQSRLQAFRKKTYSINVSSRAPELLGTIRASGNLLELGLDELVQGGGVPEVKLEAVAVRLCSTCVAHLSTASDDQTREFGSLLQGDDTVDGSGANTGVGGAGSARSVGGSSQTRRQSSRWRNILAGASAGGDSFDALWLEFRLSLLLGQLCGVAAGLKFDELVSFLEVSLIIVGFDFSDFDVNVVNTVLIDIVNTTVKVDELTSSLNREGRSKGAGGEEDKGNSTCKGKLDARLVRLRSSGRTSQQLTFMAG